MSDRSGDLLRCLTSANVEDRISATYKLENGDFADERIREATRKNLSHESTELLAITIIRLLVRAKDQQAIDPSLQALKETNDPYVASSAALGLSNIVETFPERSAQIRAALAAKENESKNPDIRGIARDTLMRMR